MVEGEDNWTSFQINRDQSSRESSSDLEEEKIRTYYESDSESESKFAKPHTKIKGPLKKELTRILEKDEDEESKNSNQIIIEDVDEYPSRQTSIIVSSRSSSSRRIKEQFENDIRVKRDEETSFTKTPKKKRVKKVRLWKLISRRLLIARESTFLKVWHPFVIGCCFISSIIYGMIAAFLDRYSDGQVKAVFALDWCFQAIFIAHLILKFFEEPEIERELKVSALAYLKSSFVLDVLALIPFYTLLGDFQSTLTKRVFIVKLIRLHKCFFIFNHKVPVAVFSSYLRAQSQKQKTQLQKWYEEKLKKIFGQVNQSFLPKLIRAGQICQLVVLLLFLSFFLAIFWFIACEHLQDELAEDGDFISKYKLSEKTTKQVLLILVYFSFSTMTTLTFGELQPVNYKEQLVSIGLMLIGVGTAAYTISRYSLIIKEWMVEEGYFERKSELTRLLSTFQRLNKKNKLPEKVRSDLTAHYNYQVEKGPVLQSRADFPTCVQGRLLMEISHKDFFDSYRSLFGGLQDNPNTYSHMVSQFKKRFDEKVIQQFFYRQVGVCSDSPEYQAFLVRLLEHLEPLQIRPGQVIIMPEAPVDTAYFIINGMIDIGYHKKTFLNDSITESESPVNAKMAKQMVGKNAQKQAAVPSEPDPYIFPIKRGPGDVVLGLFEFGFGKKAQFVYRAPQNAPLDCFFLRYIDWKRLSLSRDRDIISDFLSSVVINSYLEKIYLPILEFQNSQLRRDINQKKQNAKAEFEEISSQIQLSIQKMTSSFSQKRRTLRGTKNKESDKSLDQAISSDDFQMTNNSKASRVPTPESSDFLSSDLEDQEVQDNPSIDSFMQEFGDVIKVSVLEETQLKTLTRIKRQIDLEAAKVESQYSPASMRSRMDKDWFKRQSVMKRQVQKMKEDFSRSLAEIGRDSHKKYKVFEMRKQLKKKNTIQRKQDDPIVEILAQHEKQLRENKERLTKDKEAQMKKEAEEVAQEEEIERILEEKLTYLFYQLKIVLEKYYQQGKDLKTERKKVEFLEDVLLRDQSGMGAKFIASSQYQRLQSYSSRSSSSNSKIIRNSIQHQHTGSGLRMKSRSHSHTSDQQSEYDEGQSLGSLANIESSPDVRGHPLHTQTPNDLVSSSLCSFGKAQPEAHSQNAEVLNYVEDQAIHLLESMPTQLRQLSIDEIQEEDDESVSAASASYAGSISRLHEDQIMRDSPSFKRPSEDQNTYDPQDGPRYIQLGSAGEKRTRTLKRLRSKSAEDPSNQPPETRQRSVKNLLPVPLMRADSLNAGNQPQIQKRDSSENKELFKALDTLVDREQKTLSEKGQVSKRLTAKLQKKLTYHQAPQEDEENSSITEESEELEESNDSPETEIRNKILEKKLSKKKSTIKASKQESPGGQIPGNTSIRSKKSRGSSYKSLLKSQDQDLRMRFQESRDDQVIMKTPTKKQSKQFSNLSQLQEFEHGQMPESKLTQGQIYDINQQNSIKQLEFQIQSQSDMSLNSRSNFSQSSSRYHQTNTQYKSKRRLSRKILNSSKKIQILKNNTRISKKHFDMSQQLSSDAGSRLTSQISNFKNLDFIPESIQEQNSENKRSESLSISDGHSNSIHESLPSISHNLPSEITVKRSGKSKFIDQQSIQEEIEVDEEYDPRIWKQDSEIEEQETIPEEIVIRKRLTSNKNLPNGSEMFSQSTSRMNSNRSTLRKLIDSQRRQEEQEIIRRNKHKKRRREDK